MPARVERGDVSTDGGSCRAPCSSQSCYAFHCALYVDVRSRTGTRNGLVQFPGRIGNRSFCRQLHRPTTDPTSLLHARHTRSSLFLALTVPFHNRRRSLDLPRRPRCIEIIDGEPVLSPVKDEADCRVAYTIFGRRREAFSIKDSNAVATS